MSERDFVPNQDVVSIGFNLAEMALPLIALQVSEDKCLRPLAKNEAVSVIGTDGLGAIEFRQISELFFGDAKITGAIEDDARCLGFLLIVEKTAQTLCTARDMPITDQEFSRLYKKLKQSPDSVDQNPAFSYLQAAVRLYMSICPVSKTVYKTLLAQLLRSAKTFRTSKRSTNYYTLSLTLLP